MLFLRSHLQHLPGYTPSRHPSPDSPILKLNCNENPYPPSPQILQALQQVDGDWLRRYPDPTGESFRRAVGALLNVPANWIVVGNGCDDLLGLILRATVETGDRVVYPMPSYSLYRTLAQIQAATAVEVTFNRNFELPVAELVAARGKVTLVAAPNNPSGTPVPLTALHRLAQQVTGLLVIDEAYVDFADTDALPLVRDYPHVMVLRTLSKGYSLAGLRLGYGIAQPELITGIGKIRDSYSVDVLAYALGTIAIQDQSHKLGNADRVKRSRADLSDRLQALGFRVWPSQTNFLMVQPAESMHLRSGRSSPASALQLQQALKERDIWVRHIDLPGVADTLRITVGTEAQNEQLCQCLVELLGSD